ncbi:uncharacterized protein LOC121249134 [Juglans microcarpa x Juglans regia]|uniref:uncharacterized protein LOC121249134 n=1 Tax=Juglans microcarpa x Juglans regia TaxID=2249226 RepID=UPI001B7E8973|nr:uncharacterized protein LOC121249134 [Juglans microcarpa x Juglans regia]
MGVVEASKGVVGDIRRRFGGIKERVLEKMAAAAVPADALDNARHLLETTVRDVTVAAQGLTKDALHRVKTQLVDVLPSLSPAITTKMVDEADKEANRDENAESERGEEESNDHDQPPRQDDDDDSTHGKAPFISPASSLFLNIPLSRL